MVKQRNIYMLIPTKSIGGSEKRMIGFWNYAKKNTSLPIKLVLSPELHSKVTSIAELKEAKEFDSDIVVEPMDFDNSYQFGVFSKRFVAKHAQKKDLLHFISIFPLSAFIENPTLYSFTASSLKTLNLKGRIGSWISFIRATEVDILDPIVFNKVSSFPYLRKKVHMTPSSFIDSNFFSRINFDDKKNFIVHLGRFDKGKRIALFAESIPLIHKTLQENGIHDAEYFIIGYGEQESEIKDIISSSAFNDIKFHCFFAENPQDALMNSKVILSIQSENNYPSKALLEGIACGNIPVVTDVGTTRMIARPEFSYYINQDFGGEELANAIVAVLKMNRTEFAEKANKGKEFIENNFTIEKMAEYYSKLYNKFLGNNV